MLIFIKFIKFNRNSIAIKIKGLFLLSIVAPSVSFSQYSDQEIKTAIKKAGSPELFIKNMAKEGASNLPSKVNANTEIQGMTSDGLNLMYSIRLLNIDKKSISNISEFKKNNVGYSACQSNVLGYLIREHNARISYQYISKEMEFLFQHDLDRKSCAGK